MEEESFEDEEIARYINEHYIAIKVDREERPDIDAVYMSAVQALTGRGGWPMTVWLTAGPQAVLRRHLLPAARRRPRRAHRLPDPAAQARATSTTSDPDAQSPSAASSLAEAVRQSLSAPDPAETGCPAARYCRRRRRALESQFDPENGGTRGAPKFPSGLPLRFLLRYHRRSGRPAVAARWRR